MLNDELVSWCLPKWWRNKTSPLELKGSDVNENKGSNENLSYIESPPPLSLPDQTIHEFIESRWPGKYKYIHIWNIHKLHKLYLYRYYEFVKSCWWIRLSNHFRPLNLGVNFREWTCIEIQEGLSVLYDAKGVSSLKLHPLGSKIPVLKMIISKFRDLLFQRVPCLFSEVYPTICLLPKHVTRVPLDVSWMTRILAPNALSTHNFQGNQWDVGCMCWASQAAGSKYHQRSQGDWWRAPCLPGVKKQGSPMVNWLWDKMLMSVSCNGFVGGFGWWWWCTQGPILRKPLNSFPSGFFSYRIGSTTNNPDFSKPIADT